MRGVANLPREIYFSLQYLGVSVGRGEELGYGAKIHFDGTSDNVFSQILLLKQLRFASDNAEII